MKQKVFTNLTADETRQALVQAVIAKRGGIPFYGMLYVEWHPLGVNGDVRVEISEANPQPKKED